MTDRTSWYSAAVTSCSRRPCAGFSREATGDRPPIALSSPAREAQLKARYTARIAPFLPVVQPGCASTQR
jgi:hypothetical protein